MDLKDLKVFAKELLSSEDSKIYEAGTLKLLDMLLKAELALLDKDLKLNKDSSTGDTDEDDDDDNTSNVISFG